MRMRQSFDAPYRWKPDRADGASSGVLQAPRARRSTPSRRMSRYRSGKNSAPILGSSGLFSEAVAVSKERYKATVEMVDSLVCPAADVEDPPFLPVHAPQQ